jgi:hypothetical protein
MCSATSKVAEHANRIPHRFEIRFHDQVACGMAESVVDSLEAVHVRTDD